MVTLYFLRQVVSFPFGLSETLAQPLVAVSGNALWGTPISAMFDCDDKQWHIIRFNASDCF